jgi:hypothetical protein
MTNHIKNFVLPYFHHSDAGAIALENHSYYSSIQAYFVIPTQEESHSKITQTSALLLFRRRRNRTRKSLIQTTQNNFSFKKVIVLYNLEVVTFIKNNKTKINFFAFGESNI